MPCEQRSWRLTPLLVPPRSAARRPPGRASRWVIRAEISSIQRVTVNEPSDLSKTRRDTYGDQQPSLQVDTWAGDSETAHKVAHIETRPSAGRTEHSCGLSAGGSVRLDAYGDW